MALQFNTPAYPGKVSVGWVQENAIAVWHIEKLLRLKSLIELEIVNRTMTGKHPNSKKENDNGFQG